MRTTREPRKRLTCRLAGGRPQSRRSAHRRRASPCAAAGRRPAYWRAERTGARRKGTLIMATPRFRTTLCHGTLHRPCAARRDLRRIHRPTADQRPVHEHGRCGSGWGDGLCRKRVASGDRGPLRTFPASAPGTRRDPGACRGCRVQRRSRWRALHRSSSSEETTGRSRAIKKIFVTRVSFHPATITFSAETPGRHDPGHAERPGWTKGSVLSALPQPRSRLCPLLRGRATAGAGRGPVRGAPQRLPLLHAGRSAP